MRCVQLVLVVLGFWSILPAQQLAFPEAEGYGKYSVGGRGGAVLEVTQLGDTGEGSLRAAVEASGARTVVFRVSGNIELESPLVVTHPYLTIAGQTAPGDGICIKGFPVIIAADHVVMRYLRVRLGDVHGVEEDAISSRFVKHLILDHVSASWSIDETVSIYHCDSITVQWCIISESLYNSRHSKGPHGYGGIWGSNFGTYHHNLFAHHSSRNPRFASASGYTDYRNNVIYNWGYNSCYGGEMHQRGKANVDHSTINLVANYYKPGPATQPGQVSYRIANPSSNNGTADYGMWHVADNMVEGYPNVTSNNWHGGVQTQDSIAPDILRVEKPWPSMPIKQQSADDAYALVLEGAGAILPVRDAIDRRIVAEVQEGYATYEGTAYEGMHIVADTTRLCGIIDSQEDVGGWPDLDNRPAPADSDHDGMADDWEDAHHLDKTDPEDRNVVSADGYTMLEKYLNGLR